VSDLAYKVIVPVALVCVATLAGRRWGHQATGLVGGLPIIAGPILFFYALEQGSAFAAQAAVATDLGLVSLCAFLLAYCWRSWSGGTALSSLLMGWGAFAAFTVLIDGVSRNHAVGPLKALIYALATLYLSRRSLPPLEEQGEAAALDRLKPDPWDLPLRMAAAALLVLSLTALADRLGSRLGGLLAAFPVASSVLSVFAQRQGGREAVRAVIKGFLLALNSYAVFCAVLALGLAALGGMLAPCFALAALAACLTHMFTVRRVLKGPAH
jgi:hypothetical protein